MGGKHKKKPSQAEASAPSNQETRKLVQQEQPVQERPQKQPKKLGEQKKSDFLDEESSLMTLIMQIKVLLWKNWTILKRKKRIMVFMTITPLMICFMLSSIESISKESYQVISIHERDIEPIKPIRRCVSARFSDIECTTVGYGIIGSKQQDSRGKYDYIHQIMKNAASANDLEYGVDIKPVVVGAPSDMLEYLETNPNATLYAVMFCDSEWRDTFQRSLLNGTKSEYDLRFPCKFNHKEDNRHMLMYTMYYNFTLTPNLILKKFSEPYYKDFNLMSLKQSIDNGILKYKAEQNGWDHVPQIQTDYQAYPYVPDRLFKNMNTETNYGSMYIALVPLSVFIILYQEMIREKMQRQRFGLLVIGCSNTAFWISWIITGTIFSVASTFLMLGFGYGFGFQLFVASPLWILFPFFFSICMLNVSLTALMTTLMSSQSMAYSVNYAFILIQILLSMVLTDSFTVYKLFYNDNQAEWVTNLGYLFMIMPGFHFSKMYGDIVRITLQHFVPTTFSWESGRQYTYDDMFVTRRGTFINKDSFCVPSIFVQFQTVWGLFIVYFMLALYFDNILQHNRGKAEPYLFFLQPSYWFRSQKKDYEFDDLSPHKKRKQSMVADLEQSEKFQDTALEEKKAVKHMEKEKEKCQGVRIMGLSTDYSSSVWDSKQTENIHALKNLYVDINQGELLGVMGHNGAGKTTLINTLCGLVQNKDGNARIFDQELIKDLAYIRRRMGIVNQDDVLIDELTGAEHMYLYSEIKRMRGERVGPITIKRMKQVGLTEAMDIPVGNYSGGMRRRMSVSLSTVGDPVVILMDEPTTGMDPVSRKHVWDLIQKLKKRRVLIMTTHSMEEVDLLSDKIVVLVDGTCRCVGSPLKLKKLYGEGYKVNMMCDPANTAEVVKLVHQLIPCAKLEEDSSGNLVFIITQDKVKELSPVFKLIESKSHNAADSKESPLINKLKGMIFDVGVSQTTIEEVFMKATKMFHNTA